MYSGNHKEKQKEIGKRAKLFFVATSVIQVSVLIGFWYHVLYG
jgi:hypothetical protein